MKLFRYYAWHSFINQIKKMFRSTVMLVIAIIFGIGLIFGIGAGIATSIFMNTAEESMDSEYSEDSKEDDSYEDENIDGESIDADNNGDEDIDSDIEGQDEDYDEYDFRPSKETVRTVVGSLVVIILTLMLIWGIYSGSERGSDIFLMPDVNFLFTAPLKPQSVLLFRLVFQMFAILLGSIYVFFQIPNLLNGGLSIMTAIVVIIAWVLALVIQKLVSVFTYTVTATYTKLRTLIKPLVIIILAGNTGAFAYVLRQQDMDIMCTLHVLYGGTWTRYVPFIGWMKEMLIASINNDVAMVMLFALLNVTSIVVLIIIIWSIKADFYEDAMAGATRRDAVIRSMKEKNKKVNANNIVVTEKKLQKAEKKAEKKASKNIKMFGGSGASTFFTKEMFVRRREAKFGLITNTMLLYIACVSIPGYILYVNDFANFIPIGIVLGFIIYFRNYGNPIASETSMNWIYLVPDSSMKKVFYAVFAGSISCMLDIIPALILGMYFTERNVLNCVLWMCVLVTLDFALSNLGLILEALLPGSSLNTVKSMLQFMLKTLITMVLVGLFIAACVLAGVTIGLSAAIVVNLALGVALFVIYPSMM